MYLLIWPHLTACGILVPRPGIEPTPPVLEARSFNLWTAREVLEVLFCCNLKKGIHKKEKKRQNILLPPEYTVALSTEAQEDRARGCDKRCQDCLQCQCPKGADCLGAPEASALHISTSNNELQ